MRAVNLLPVEQRRARPSGERSGGAFVVVGVLAVLLVMAVAYVLTGNQANERRSKAQAANAEAAQLEAEAAQQDSFVDFAAIKQTRLVSVSGVAESRFDWERLMRELAHVMPAGSWLQTADASVAGEAGTDQTASAPATADAGPVQPTLNLTGCTPHQPDVARMMVRLGELNRVEDVELNESALESGEQNATTVDNCGSLYHFDLSVTFTPQAPVAEAPRGETRVPASLGGGS